MFDFLNKPIGWVINLCYKVIPNYAIALLIFALVMKIVLFPFGIKQQKNMIRQAKLRPKEQAIRKRYAGRDDKVTQQKMQQDLMKLYQDENYNPASGCLPMILQLVIIFALYGVIRAPLTYVSDLNKTEINELGVGIVRLYDDELLEEKDFSKTTWEAIVKQGKEIDEEKEDRFEDVKNPISDQVELVRIVRENYGLLESNGYLPKNVTLKDLPDFTIFGGKFDLSRTPSFDNFDWLMLIPLLTFIFTFGSMKLTKKLTYQSELQQQQQAANMGCSMKIMDYMMPLMSTFITFTVPAIIAVYWIYNNVLSTLQQLVLKLMYPTPVFTEEDYKNAEREMNKGVKQPKKKSTKRAAHRIDLDDDDEAATEKKPESAPKKNTDAKASLIAPAAIKDESDKKSESD